MTTPLQAGLKAVEGMAISASFKLKNREEKELVEKIVSRIQKMLADVPSAPAVFDRMHWTMNIIACHVNGNPLRLIDLLNADDFNFAHDVLGIDRHLCRKTGNLLDFFSPRFSDTKTRSAISKARRQS